MPVFQEQTNHYYPLISPDCYIYLHHARPDPSSAKTGLMIILPSYADDVNDTIQVNFTSSTPLGRSAPIYSYSNSGPRSLSVVFDLHRDLISELNYSNNSVIKGDDYVDVMAREIQAAALPTYTDSEKMINPPLVSLKLGNDIFIKGVISGSVGVSYGLPVLRNDKYARVKITFGINEVAPYDADSVIKYGSFRGLESREIWTTNVSGNSSSSSSFSSTGTVNNTAIRGDVNRW